MALPPYRPQFPFCTAATFKARLVELGLYALTHDHSRWWISAIEVILRRRGLAHG
jgi:hypothetical protein